VRKIGRCRRYGGRYSGGDVRYILILKPAETACRAMVNRFLGGAGHAACVVRTNGHCWRRTLPHCPFAPSSRWTCRVLHLLVGITRRRRVMFPGVFLRGFWLHLVRVWWTFCSSPGNGGSLICTSLGCIPRLHKAAKAVAVPWAWISCMPFCSGVPSAWLDEHARLPSLSQHTTPSIIVVWFFAVVLWACVTIWRAGGLIPTGVTRISSATYFIFIAASG